MRHKFGLILGFYLDGKFSHKIGRIGLGMTREDPAFYREPLRHDNYGGARELSPRLGAPMIA